ncbi:MAG: tetratricopeptide repeat protein [Planctomycetota bacterium]
MANTPLAVSDWPLAGQCVHILGPLSSMTRRDASLLLKRHGADVTAKIDADTTLVLVGDETSDQTSDWQSALREAAPAELLDDATTLPFEVVAETDLWERIGLFEAGDADQRFYTPALLAQLVDAPVAAIRRWTRRGYLVPAKQIGRLSCFTIAEVRVARNLASLQAEGSSLAKIDKLVAQLTAVAPGVDRPLAELAVVSQGGKLFLRRGDDLAEPHGQLLLDFDEEPEAPDSTSTIAFSPLSLFAGDTRATGDQATDDWEASDDLPANAFSADEARSAALEHQASGDLQKAIESARAACFAGGDVEDHVLLADLLYQAGDVSAARERYYAALELDGADLESRVSLGCLLNEQGDLELAAAAFRGALSQQPNFADAIYHLARTLDELEQGDAAEPYWRQFLSVAPAGPWSDEAATRLGMEPV